MTPAQPLIFRQRLMQRTARYRICRCPYGQTTNAASGIWTKEISRKMVMDHGEWKSNCTRSSSVSERLNDIMSFLDPIVSSSSSRSHPPPRVSSPLRASSARSTRTPPPCMSVYTTPSILSARQHESEHPS
eukprot:488552-Rhodomonas_salina.1